MLFRKVSVRAGALAFATLALSSAGFGASEVDPKPVATPAAKALADSGGRSSEPDQYLIAPGDILRISVWKEPELTADVFVRLDGRITVPLVGDVQAAGLTPDQLTMDLRTKFRRFVESPQVTITVSQAVSARVFVLGEVVNSGAYSLTGRTTVIQALALAGGFREFAKRDQIVVIRDRNGYRKAIPFDYKQVKSGAALEQNIVLEAGDTILVP